MLTLPEYLVKHDKQLNKLNRGAMGAIEFVVDHLAEVLKAYEGEPGHDEAFRKLQDQFPGLSSELSFASFKQYAGIVLRLNKKINILDALNKDKQLNTINKGDALNSDKHLQVAKQEINTLNEQLNIVKQENERLESLNMELNNTIEMLNTRINKIESLNIDKQGIDKINKGESVSDDKQKINIAGWSIQKSGGFYRAFRRIKGKMQGVYIGKNLDDAESKIRMKEQALQEVTP